MIGERVTVRTTDDRGVSGVNVVTGVVRSYNWGNEGMFDSGYSTMEIVLDGRPLNQFEPLRTLAAPSGKKSKTKKEAVMEEYPKFYIIDSPATRSVKIHVEVEKDKFADRSAGEELVDCKPGEEMPLWLSMPTDQFDAFASAAAAFKR